MTTIWVLLVLLADTGRIPPVAMVLEVKGRVMLGRTPGEEKPIRLMDLLLEKDRVVTDRDAEISLVFLGDGHRETLKGAKAITVDSGHCEPRNAVELKPPLDAKQKAVQRGLHELKKGGPFAGLVFRDALPNDSTPPRVSPIRGSFVVTARPSLEWSPIQGAEVYEVSITSTSDKLLWRIDTKEAKVDWPEKQAALERGLKYVWTVHAMANGRPVGKPIASHFFAMTPDDAKALEAVAPFTKVESVSNLVLAAVTFQAYGVDDEALRLYERLAKIAPNEPAFHAALAWYLLKAGRPDEAKGARAKAIELGYKAPRDS